MLGFSLDQDRLVLLGSEFGWFFRIWIFGFSARIGSWFFFSGMYGFFKDLDVCFSDLDCFVC
jgi:hypothetical protein